MKSSILLFLPFSPQPLPPRPAGFYHNILPGLFGRRIIYVYEGQPDLGLFSFWPHVEPLTSYTVYLN